MSGAGSETRSHPSLPTTPVLTLSPPLPIPCTTPHPSSLPPPCPQAERAACRTNTCRHASTPTKTSQGMIGTMFGMLTGVGKRGKKGEGVREAIEVDEGDEGGREGLWRVGEVRGGRGV